MGNVLQVELPVGLDEQQMQGIPSTPGIRRPQPVSTKAGVKRPHSPDFCAGAGRLPSRTTTTTDGVQRGDPPPLVNLGVSHPLRAYIGFWNFADNDQPSDLVATRFFAPGKNVNTLTRW